MIDADQALADVTPPQTTTAEVNVMRYFRGQRDLVPAALAAETADSPEAVLVTANHGRWIVECPSGDGGAQFASREDRRFMCVECLNATVSGLWRPAVWPDEVDEIQAALEVRPEQNQNWTPDQTVEDLDAENEEN